MRFVWMPRAAARLTLLEAAPSRKRIGYRQPGQRNRQKSDRQKSHGSSDCLAPARVVDTSGRHVNAPSNPPSKEFSCFMISLEVSTPGIAERKSTPRNQFDFEAEAAKTL